GEDACGGCIWLLVGNLARIDGTVSATSRTGGAVYLEAGLLAGSGYLTANAWSHTSSTNLRGGQVAVVYGALDEQAPFSFDHLQARGALTCSTDCGNVQGEAGTVFYRRADEEEGVLVLDNGPEHKPTSLEHLLYQPGGGSWTNVDAAAGQLTNSVASFSEGSLVGLWLVADDQEPQERFRVRSHDTTHVWVEDPQGRLGLVADAGDRYRFELPLRQLELHNAVRLALHAPLRVAGDVVITTASVIHGLVTAGPDTPVPMEVHCRRLEVGALAELSVVGSGYTGARGPGHPGSSWSYGGSHAGHGTGATSMSLIYGNPLDPLTAGSGGRYGSGGGLLTVNCAEIAVDGLLDASAVASSSAGSGGSVALHGQLLSGAGAILARGGPGGSYKGGGGRILLDVDELDAGFDLATQLSVAAGGAGAEGGTIYSPWDHLCPGGFVWQEGLCLRALPTALSWAEAEAACAALAAGAHLASLQGAGELHLALHRAQEAAADLWVGLTDQAVEGTFAW
ncbi:MAG: hypothetical protein FJ125_18420, partial [Deltaproteobacteria bacterium]|nr:hypothetical protein [Deltaproteobacteria bacterium]